MASTAPASCCFRRRHRSAPRPPEIISSTIASCGRLSSHCSSASPTAERQVHVVALGAQEELRQVRRHGIAFGEQHEQPRASAWTVVRQGWPPSLLLGEQPVRVGRREPARNLRRDEAQLLHVVARVEAVSPRAPFRDDRRVALLPVADRRDGNLEHPSHRTDAVDAALAASLSDTAGMLTDAPRVGEAIEPKLMRNSRK